MYFMWPVEVIVVLVVASLYLGYEVGNRLGLIKSKKKKGSCGCGKCQCGGK